MTGGERGVFAPLPGKAGGGGVLVGVWAPDSRAYTAASCFLGLWGGLYEDALCTMGGRGRWGFLEIRGLISDVDRAVAPPSLLEGGASAPPAKGGSSNGLSLSL